MSTLTNEKPATMQDIYDLPEGQRAELIDGRLYMMAPPKRIHQKIIGKLYRIIDNYIEDNNLPCETYIAPFGVWLFGDDSTLVEPDISVICDSSKLDDEGCKGAPDFIIEILSPSNKYHDCVRKLKLYCDAGVREYWIVNTEKRWVRKHVFSPEYTDEQYSFDEDVCAEIHIDFSVNLGKAGL